MVEKNLPLFLGGAFGLELLLDKTALGEMQGRNPNYHRQQQHNFYYRIKYTTRRSPIFIFVI
jgi:hypothetical protein